MMIVKYKYCSEANTGKDNKQGCIPTDLLVVKSKINKKIKKIKIIIIISTNK